MSLDEIKSRDADCTDLEARMTHTLKTIDSARNKQLEIETLKEQAGEFQTHLDAIRIELKSASIAHMDREHYKKRHKELKGILEELLLQIQGADKSETRDELFAGGGGPVHNLETEAGLIAHADAVTADSKASLARTAGVVAQTIDIAKDTTVKLKAHTQQITGMYDDLMVIDSTVDRAAAILKRMARRVATDKYLWVVVFLVFAAVVFIIVWKNVNPDAAVAVPDQLIKK